MPQFSYRKILSSSLCLQYSQKKRRANSIAGDGEREIKVFAFHLNIYL
eukprot:UN23818